MYLRLNFRSVLTLGWAVAAVANSSARAGDLRAEFLNPPDAARPGVYWYFQDGNQDRASMTADLEAMRQVGLGSVLFLEVDSGVPSGPVKFMSEAWQENFAHAVKTTERLGMEFILGTGPGWAGSGGPWIKPEDSMQHLVGERIELEGPARLERVLPVPAPLKPNRYAGMTPEFNQLRDNWYRDVAVLAYPTPAQPVGEVSPKQIKTLQDILPYSSDKSAQLYVPMRGQYPETNADGAFDAARVVDITAHMNAAGTLRWDVPPGKWTVYRFVARSTGQTTRPAPKPGHGFECDKFSADAYAKQWANFQAKLLERVKPGVDGKGWTRIHLDSWEMSSQNWSDGFRKAFRAARGYDPQPYYPAFLGQVVSNRETTERFLFDLRLTAQELVLKNHAGTIKRIAHQHGMGVSIEPYDMNPAGDIDLGSVADIPMCEFWTPRGYDAVYGCVEAASIAHVMGRPVVSAEAFTAGLEHARFDPYPGSMKNQADWAFAMGINSLMFHTFAHQPLGADILPGMYFGNWGVNWHRNQTWWDMLPAFHRYIARCSHLLRQGEAVADLLYLTPEGAPMIFAPPPDAMEGRGALRDKKAYSFDAVSPRLLMQRAKVENGMIVFSGGSRYRLLVLPKQNTMTPELLTCIESLVAKGATIIGNPALASPSLVGFPACDQRVRQLSASLWGDAPAPAQVSAKTHGQGTIFWGGPLSPANPTGADLYPTYTASAAVLRELDVPPDFVADNNRLRFIHRRAGHREIYFVSNRTAEEQQASATFRVTGKRPALWHPDTGKGRSLPEFSKGEATTTVPLRFAPHESYFVVFSDEKSELAAAPSNFPSDAVIKTLAGAWSLSFDPKRGGPEQISFPELTDWTEHPQRGVKYYSGVATYRKTFDLPSGIKAGDELLLDLGRFHEVARVSINGQNLGVIWAQPHRLTLGSALKSQGNELVIEVANSWENRLLGDQTPEDRQARTLQWKTGLLGGKSFKTGRYTFTTVQKLEPQALRPSGLLGPVQLLRRHR